MEMDTLALGQLLTEFFGEQRAASQCTTIVFEDHSREITFPIGDSKSVSYKSTHSTITTYAFMALIPLIEQLNMKPIQTKVSVCELPKGETITIVLDKDGLPLFASLQS